MREAIEKVIAELEQRKQMAIELVTPCSFAYGQAYDIAIDKLKEVIASETGDTRQTSTGSQDDTAEQIQE